MIFGRGRVSLWEEGKVERLSILGESVNPVLTVVLLRRVTWIAESHLDSSDVSECSENVVCSSFVGCTVESVAACFCVSPNTVASVCEAVLPGSGILDRKVIPLCKVHHSHLYK